MLTTEYTRKPDFARRGAPVQTVRQTFVVNIEHGLHARPCALLVKTLRPFRADVQVSANGEIANGRSVMGLMILAAGYRSNIIFTISGEDAHQAMDAVSHLFDTQFAEAYQAVAA